MEAQNLARKTVVFLVTHLTPNLATILLAEAKSYGSGTFSARTRLFAKRRKDFGFIVHSGRKPL